MQNVVQRIFDKWYENLPFTLNMVWTPVPVILLYNTTKSFSQKEEKRKKKKKKRIKKKNSTTKDVFTN